MVAREVVEQATEAVGVAVLSLMVAEMRTVMTPHFVGATN